MGDELFSSVRKINALTSNRVLNSFWDKHSIERYFYTNIGYVGVWVTTQNIFADMVKRNMNNGFLNNTSFILTKLINLMKI